MKKNRGMALLLAVVLTITACGNSRQEENSGREAESSIREPEQTEVNTVPMDARQKETEQEEAEQKETEREETEQGETEQGETEQEAAGMKIQVGDTIFTATLAENSSVDGLKELLAGGALTLNMSDYANMEKGADLGVTLPQNNERMNTQAGDIILYQGRQFVIYYDTNSWSLTPLGKIDNVDVEELREILGTGDVTVTLSLE